MLGGEWRTGEVHADSKTGHTYRFLMCVCKCPETQTELAIHLKGMFQILEQFIKGLITQNASFQHVNRVIIFNRIICNLEK